MKTIQIGDFVYEVDQTTYDRLISLRKQYKASLDNIKVAYTLAKLYDRELDLAIFNSKSMREIDQIFKYVGK